MIFLTLIAIKIPSAFKFDDQERCQRRELNDGVVLQIIAQCVHTCKDEKAKRRAKLK
jgi:hypothetical protein